MKRTTRITAAFLIAATTIGMSACGRSDSKDSATATGSAVSSGSASGTLTMWAMGAEGEKLPALVKQFEAANPGVKVNVTAIPWDSAHDKFTSSIAASQTPDLAMVGSTWMGEFVGLDALDATPSNIDKSVFFPGAQKTTEVGGSSYGVPWYVETRALYYRKDLAAKAGITSAPKTWDELSAMAKAYKEKAGTKWGINLQPGGVGSWQTVLPFAWTNGAKVSDEGATKWTLDSPEMVEAVSFYQSFFKNGLSNPAPVEGQTEADFTSGANPMFISGPWMMSAVEKLGGAGFKDKYAVAQIPTKKEHASFVGGANLAVFKASKNRDAAWKLVQFLTDPKTQVEWYKSSTDLPSVQSAWTDPTLTSDAKMAVFGEQLKTAIAPPSVPTWEKVATAFDTEIEKVTKNNADPAAAVKAAQAEADTIGVK